jgi:hypothetical protein
MLLSFQKLFARATNRNGFALVLVLAFVVLLTGIALAFLSSSLLQREVSNSSANIAKADLLAQGAVDTTIGDLKAEIAAGSTAVPIVTGAVTTTIYAPKSSTGQTYAQNTGNYTTMLPATQGFTRATYAPGAIDPLANLVKVSANAPFYQGGAYTGAGPTRAANSPTTSGSRALTLARWNKALFLPATGTTDLTPTGAFPTPNWIYVSSNGGNPTSVDTNVVGRYAYAIYDEGGLLDINVAGYPNAMNPPTTAYPDAAYKGAEAYADLTTIGLTQAQINQIVNWRNQATITASGGGINNLNYRTYVAANTSGFMKTDSIGFRGTGVTTLPGGVSDRMFVGRQQFIDFLKTAPGFNKTEQDALQYLTTFSRDLNQPSYIRLQATNAGNALDYNAQAPHVLGTANGGNYYKPGSPTQGHDQDVNPSFPSVRVTATFPRNDGTPAVVGEPLVKKRFALERLAWITYKGPSANRSQGDADIQALINNGIPWEYLQKGTDENIRKYFGLQWQGSKWTYSNNHSGAAGPINILANLTGTREPDFFELLKATINVGSVGKALLPSNTFVPPPAGKDEPYNYNYYSESSVDFQILQIGANIISQYQPANYPPQIVFDDGGGKVYSQRTIVGVENLPYLYNILSGILQLQPPNPLPRSSPTALPGTGKHPNSVYAPGDKLASSGVGALMELPVIWNPHDPSSPLTNANGLSPTEIRVVADSTDPVTAESGGGTYNSFFVLGAATAGYSNAADPSSPGAASPGMTSNSWYTGGASGKSFKAATTEIHLQLNGTGPRPFFSEPTILMRPGSLKDANGNSFSVSIPSANAMQADSEVKGFFGSGGLLSYAPNAPGMQAPYEKTDPANTPYVGFYLGAFPMAWNPSSTGAPLSAAQTGCILSRYPAGVGPAFQATCYMTYRMQYKDPNTGGWVTYDTKYGQVTNTNVVNTFSVNSPPGPPGPPGTPTIIEPSLICGINGEGGFWASATDPRTSRFGLLCSGTSGANSMAGNHLASPVPMVEFESWDTAHWPPYPYVQDNATGWLDTANAIIYTTRPDGDTGSYFANKTNGQGCWPFGTTTTDGKASGWMAYTASDPASAIAGNPAPGIAPGLLSQNNTDIFYDPNRFYAAVNGNDIHTPNYFADPDGMVRRGMGAFVPSGTLSSPTYIPVFKYRGIPSADTTVGLPIARAFDWNKNNTNYPKKPDPAIAVYTSPTQATSQAQSRPYFLHRPFYSVAELGYVFSDTPWRNLDFFTAESGSAALLDVFCTNDTNDPDGLVAGKVNLNSAQAPVLQAVLAGAYLDPVQPVAGMATGHFDTATARAVADALLARLNDTTNVNNGTGRLRNVSELVGKWVANKAIVQLPTSNQNPSGITTNMGTLSSSNGFYDGKLSYAGFSGGVWDNSSGNLGATSRKPYANGVEDFSSGKPSGTGTAMDIYSAYVGSGTFSTNGNKNGSRETVAYIQRFREAPIRALASAGQTRIWNLMIDVVAQTGRFPQSATALDKFAVEGERRYWVHVAIDRYTGQVVDKQIEVVKE